MLFNPQIFFYGLSKKILRFFIVEVYRDLYYYVVKA